MICALELERREDPERLWSWPFEIGLRVERQADSGGGQPIYRRLPCFLIATVDKFASLPFEGRVGALLGKVERFDEHGFYGPCDPGRGRPLEKPILTRT